MTNFENPEMDQEIRATDRKGLFFDKSNRSSNRKTWPEFWLDCLKIVAGTWFKGVCGEAKPPHRLVGRAASPEGDQIRRNHLIRVIDKPASGSIGSPTSRLIETIGQEKSVEPIDAPA
jgi:hypothetical protein